MNHSLLVVLITTFTLLSSPSTQAATTAAPAQDHATGDFQKSRHEVDRLRRALRKQQVVAALQSTSSDAHDEEELADDDTVISAESQTIADDETVDEPVADEDDIDPLKRDPFAIPERPELPLRPNKPARLNNDQDKMWDAIEQLIPRLHITHETTDRPQTAEVRKAIQQLTDFIDDDRLPGNKKRRTIASNNELQQLLLFTILYIQKEASPYGEDDGVRKDMQELTGELILQWGNLDMNFNAALDQHLGSVYDLHASWKNMILSPRQEQFLNNFQDALVILRKDEPNKRELAQAIDQAYAAFNEIIDDEALLGHSRTRALVRAMPTEVIEGLQSELDDSAYKKMRKMYEGLLDKVDIFFLSPNEQRDERADLEAGLLDLEDKEDTATRARKLLLDIAIDLYKNPSDLESQNFATLKREDESFWDLANLNIPRLTDVCSELRTMVSEDLLTNYEFPLLTVLDLSDTFFQRARTMTPAYRYPLAAEASDLLDHLTSIFERTNDPRREISAMLSGKYDAIALAQSDEKALYDRLEKTIPHLLETAVAIEQRDGVMNFRTSLTPAFQRLLDESRPARSDLPERLDDRYHTLISEASEILKKETPRIVANHMLRIYFIDPDLGSVSSNTPTRPKPVMRRIPDGLTPANRSASQNFMRLLNHLFALHLGEKSHQRSELFAYDWSNAERMVLGMFEPLHILLYGTKVSINVTPVEEGLFQTEDNVEQVISLLKQIHRMLTMQSSKDRRDILRTNDKLRSDFLKTIIFPGDVFAKARAELVGDDDDIMSIDPSNMGAMSRKLGDQVYRYRLADIGMNILNALQSQEVDIGLTPADHARIGQARSDFERLALINDAEIQLKERIEEAVATIRRNTKVIESAKTPEERDDALLEYEAAALTLTEAIRHKGTRQFIGHNPLCRVFFDEKGNFILFEERGSEAIPENLHHNKSAQRAIVDLLKKIWRHPNDLNFKRTKALEVIIQGYIDDANTSDLDELQQMSDAHQELYAKIDTALINMHNAATYGEGAEQLNNIFRDKESGKDAIRAVKEKRLIAARLFSNKGLYKVPVENVSKPHLTLDQSAGFTGYHLYKFILDNDGDFGLDVRFSSSKDNTVALGILREHMDNFQIFTAENFAEIVAAERAEATRAATLQEQATGMPGVTPGPTIASTPGLSLAGAESPEAREALGTIMRLRAQLKDADTFNRAIKVLSNKFNDSAKREKLGEYPFVIRRLFDISGSGLLLTPDWFPKYLRLDGLKAAVELYDNYLQNERDLTWGTRPDMKDDEDSIREQLNELATMFKERLRKLEESGDDEEVPEVKTTKRIEKNGRIPTPEEAMGKRRDTSDWDDDAARLYNYLYDTGYMDMRSIKTSDFKRAAHTIYRQLTGRDISERFNLIEADDNAEIYFMMGKALLRNALYTAILVAFLPDDIGDATKAERKDISKLYELFLQKGPRFRVNRMIRGELETLIEWLHDPTKASTRNDRRLSAVVNEGRKKPVGNMMMQGGMALQPGMPRMAGMQGMPMYGNMTSYPGIMPGIMPGMMAPHQLMGEKGRKNSIGQSLKTDMQIAMLEGQMPMMAGGMVPGMMPGMQPHMGGMMHSPYGMTYNPYGMGMSSGKVRGASVGTAVFEQQYQRDEMERIAERNKRELKEEMEKAARIKELEQRQKQLEESREADIKAALEEAERKRKEKEAIEELREQVENMKKHGVKAPQGQSPLGGSASPSTAAPPAYAQPGYPVPFMGPLSGSPLATTAGNSAWKKAQNGFKKQAEETKSKAEKQAQEKQARKDLLYKRIIERLDHNIAQTQARIEANKAEGRPNDKLKAHLKELRERRDQFEMQHMEQDLIDYGISQKARDFAKKDQGPLEDRTIADAQAEYNKLRRDLMKIERLMNDAGVSKQEKALLEEERADIRDQSRELTGFIRRARANKRRTALFETEPGAGLEEKLQAHMNQIDRAEEKYEKHKKEYNAAFDQRASNKQLKLLYTEAEKARRHLIALRDAYRRRVEAHLNGRSLEEQEEYEKASKKKKKSPDALSDAAIAKITIDEWLEHIGALMTRLVTLDASVGEEDPAFVFCNLNRIFLEDLKSALAEKSNKSAPFPDQLSVHDQVWKSLQALEARKKKEVESIEQIMMRLKDDSSIDLNAIAKVNQKYEKDREETLNKVFNTYSLKDREKMETALREAANNPLLEPFRTKEITPQTIDRARDEINTAHKQLTVTIDLQIKDLKERIAEIKDKSWVFNKNEKKKKRHQQLLEHYEQKKEQYNRDKANALEYFDWLEKRKADRYSATVAKLVKQLHVLSEITPEWKDDEDLGRGLLFSAKHILSKEPAVHQHFPKIYSNTTFPDRTFYNNPKRTIYHSFYYEDVAAEEFTPPERLVVFDGTSDNASASSQAGTPPSPPSPPSSPSSNSSEGTPPPPPGPQNSASGSLSSLSPGPQGQPLLPFGGGSLLDNVSDKSSLSGSGDSTLPPSPSALPRGRRHGKPVRHRVNTGYTPPPPPRKADGDFAELSGFIQRFHQIGTLVPKWAHIFYESDAYKNVIGVWKNFMQGIEDQNGVKHALSGFLNKMNPIQDEESLERRLSFIENVLKPDANYTEQQMIGDQASVISWFIQQAFRDFKETRTSALSLIKSIVTFLKDQGKIEGNFAQQVAQTVASLALGSASPNDLGQLMRQLYTIQLTPPPAPGSDQMRDWLYRIAASYPSTLTPKNRKRLELSFSAEDIDAAIMDITQEEQLWGADNPDHLARMMQEDVPLLLGEQDPQNEEQALNTMQLLANCILNDLEMLFEASMFDDNVDDQLHRIATAEDVTIEDLFKECIEALTKAINARNIQPSGEGPLLKLAQLDHSTKQRLQKGDIQALALIAPEVLKLIHSGEYISPRGPSGADHSTMLSEMQSKLKQFIAVIAQHDPSLDGRYQVQNSLVGCTKIIIDMMTELLTQVRQPGDPTWNKLNALKENIAAQFSQYQASSTPNPKDLDRISKSALSLAGEVVVYWVKQIINKEIAAHLAPAITAMEEYLQQFRGNIAVLAQTTPKYHALLSDLAFTATTPQAAFFERAQALATITSGVAQLIKQDGSQLLSQLAQHSQSILEAIADALKREDLRDLPGMAHALRKTAFDALAAGLAREIFVFLNQHKTFISTALEHDRLAITSAQPESQTSVINNLNLLRAVLEELVKRSADSSESRSIRDEISALDGELTNKDFFAAWSRARRMLSTMLGIAQTAPALPDDKSPLFVPPATEAVISEKKAHIWSVHTEMNDVAQRRASKEILAVPAAPTSADHAAQTQKLEELRALLLLTITTHRRYINSTNPSRETLEHLSAFETLVTNVRATDIDGYRSTTEAFDTYQRYARQYAQNQDVRTSLDYLTSHTTNFTRALQSANQDPHPAGARADADITDRQTQEFIDRTATALHELGLADATPAQAFIARAHDRSFSFKNRFDAIVTAHHILFINDFIQQEADPSNAFSRDLEKLRWFYHTRAELTNPQGTKQSVDQRVMSILDQVQAFTDAEPEPFSDDIVAARSQLAQIQSILQQAYSQPNKGQARKMFIDGANRILPLLEGSLKLPLDTSVNRLGRALSQLNTIVSAPDTPVIIQDLRYSEVFTILDLISAAIPKPPTLTAGAASGGGGRSAGFPPVGGPPLAGRGSGSSAGIPSGTDAEWNAFEQALHLAVMKYAPVPVRLQWLRTDVLRVPGTRNEVVWKFFTTELLGKTNLRISPSDKIVNLTAALKSVLQHLTLNTAEDSLSPLSMLRPPGDTRGQILPWVHSMLKIMTEQARKIYRGDPLRLARITRAAWTLRTDNTENEHFRGTAYLNHALGQPAGSSSNEIIAKAGDNEGHYGVFHARFTTADGSNLKNTFYQKLIDKLNVNPNGLRQQFVNPLIDGQLLAPGSITSPANYTKNGIRTWLRTEVDRQTRLLRTAPVDGVGEKADAILAKTNKRGSNQQIKNVLEGYKILVEFLTEKNALERETADLITDQIDSVLGGLFSRRKPIERYVGNFEHLFLPLTYSALYSLTQQTPVRYQLNLTETHRTAITEPPHIG